MPRFVWLCLDAQPRLQVNVNTIGRDISARPENRASITSLVTATGPGSAFNPEVDGQYVQAQPLLPLYVVRGFEHDK